MYALMSPVQSTALSGEPAVRVGQKGDAMLDAFFGIKKSGSTLGREFVAGLTTFMVMAYIIFVNPAILSFAGIKDFQGLVACGGKVYARFTSGAATLAMVVLSKPSATNQRPTSGLQAKICPAA